MEKNKLAAEAEWIDLRWYWCAGGSWVAQYLVTWESIKTRYNETNKT